MHGRTTPTLKLCCGCLLLIAAARQTLHAEPRRIGVILPLTGDFAFFGEQAKGGMLSALQDEGDSAAAQTVFFEDDHCLPRGAVDAFNKLVNIDRVEVIVGPACTGGILAVAPLARRRDIPVVALLDAGEQVARLGRPLFSLGFSSEREGAMMAEYMAGHGLLTAGILFEDDAWATLVKNAFRRRFAELGGEAPYEVNQNPRDKDYRPNIMKLLAKKPAALYFAPAYSSGLPLKQLREIDPHIPVFGPDTFGAEDVVSVAGSAAEGSIFTNVAIDEQTRVARELRRSLRERCGLKPTSLLYAALGFDGIRMVRRALGGGGRIEPALSNLRYTDGAISPNSGFGRDGMSRLEPVVMTVRNGRFEILP